MNIDDYKVTIPYPDRPKKPVLMKSEVTAKSAREYADALEKWELDMAEYRMATDVWHKALADLYSRFRKDVLREAGLEGHPKAEKVFTIAWDEGHSAGYQEVADWVWKLAELVKD